MIDSAGEKATVTAYCIDETFAIDKDDIGLREYRLRYRGRLEGYPADPKQVNVNARLMEPPIPIGSEREQKMPNVNDLKDSKFLTKEDVTPDVQVTIKGWDMQDVSLETQPKKEKYVLVFEELDKPLVLNNTNGQRIAKITGSGEFDAGDLHGFSFLFVVMGYFCQS